MSERRGLKNGRIAEGLAEGGLWRQKKKANYKITCAGVWRTTKGKWERKILRLGL